ncbi:MAG: protein phosphatase 2C domain-containing protein [Oscillospiraceae bacterium]|nr:protein phosphatase 2C domain-containing protein [Oscillospiraceae bacterium]
MNRSFGHTDIGLTRPTNQDCFDCGQISARIAFGILCDGLGGENGGEIASQTAVGLTGEVLRRELREGMSELSLRSVLSSAIAGANAVIHEKASGDEKLTGMSTTILLAVLIGDTLYVASVGDSRVYIFSPGGRRQLTKDHTVVQMLVDIGEISEEDAKRHPKRHYVTRAVGASPTVEPDFFAEHLKPGDIALLCSDGLYPYMDPEITYGLLSRCVKESNAKTLIDLALSAGTTDNITAVIMASEK